MRRFKSINRSPTDFLTSSLLHSIGGFKKIIYICIELHWNLQNLNGLLFHLVLLFWHWRWLVLRYALERVTLYFIDFDFWHKCVCICCQILLTLTKVWMISLLSIIISLWPMNILKYATKNKSRLKPWFHVKIKYYFTEFHTRAAAIGRPS